MKLVFCYSSKWASKLICWAAREPVSHVAIEFESGIIIHSQLLTGVGLDWAPHFRSEHSIPYELEMGDDEHFLMASLITKYLGRKYDSRAFIYLGIRLLLLRLLGLPLPSWNPGDVGRSYLCTELAAAILDRPTDPMITPYQLYLKLVKESARA